MVDGVIRNSQRTLVHQTVKSGPDTLSRCLLHEARSHESRNASPNHTQPNNADGTRKLGHNLLEMVVHFVIHETQPLGHLR